MGETYMATASLYLYSEVFLILGLPPTDEFWRGKDEEWTSKKIWSGKNSTHDHSIDYKNL
jgi:hypothetical protein